MSRNNENQIQECDCNFHAKCLVRHQMNKFEIEAYLMSLDTVERREYAIKHNIPLNPFTDLKIEWSPSTFQNVEPIDMFNNSLPSPNHSLMDDDHNHHLSIIQHSIMSCDHREIHEERMEMSKTFFDNYSGPDSPLNGPCDFEKSSTFEEEPELKSKEISTQTEWCIDPDWNHNGRLPFLKSLPITDDLLDATHIVYLPTYKRAQWRPLLASDSLPKAYFTDGRGMLMCDNYQKLIDGDEGPSGMTPNEYRIGRIRNMVEDDSPFKQISKFSQKSRFGGCLSDSPTNSTKHFSPMISPITPQTKVVQRSGSSFRLNISPILANSPDLIYESKNSNRIRKNSGNNPQFSGQLSFCLSDDEEENDNNGKIKNNDIIEKPTVVNSTMRINSITNDSDMEKIRIQTTLSDQGYVTSTGMSSENIDGNDISNAALASTPFKKKSAYNMVDTLFNN